MSDFLNSRHGEALYQAKVRAQRALEQVRVNYFDTLGLDEQNDRLNTGGRLAIRQAGRAYAQAVIEYSNAVMAWLRFVELEIGDPQDHTCS